MTGAVDHASIDRMMDFYQSCGATGLTVLGQLGEAPKLDFAESLDIASQVIGQGRRHAHRGGRVGAGLRFHALR